MTPVSKRLTIRKQRYRDAWGRRPLSFAIYCNHRFIAYSWSFSGAWRAVQLIKETMGWG
jgi:hypothetical protein